MYSLAESSSDGLVSYVQATLTSALWLLRTPYFCVWLGASDYRTGAITEQVRSLGEHDH